MHVKTHSLSLFFFLSLPYLLSFPSFIPVRVFQSFFLLFIFPLAYFLFFPSHLSKRLFSIHFLSHFLFLLFYPSIIFLPLISFLLSFYFQSSDVYTFWLYGLLSSRHFILISLYLTSDSLSCMFRVSFFLQFTLNLHLICISIYLFIYLFPYLRSFL